MCPVASSGRFNETKNKSGTESGTARAAARGPAPRGRGTGGVAGVRVLAAVTLLTTDEYVRDSL